MKKEKTFIKTKSIILFLMFALFCIFGISACGGDLPTNSASEISNGNNTVKLKTNLPIFGKNNPYTNIQAPNKPSQDYPPDTYRDITWFGGGGKVSYKTKNIYLIFGRI